LFTLIKSALMDPDLEELPTDYMRGLDFRITKTSKGGYADYNTSKWARKESALTNAEQDAIEKFGLFNLSEFMPKKPGEVELKVMKEMFEASVNGEEYDPERWGQYFKPSGMNFSDAAPSAKPAAAAPAESTPWEDDVSAAEKSFTPAEPTPTAPVAAPATSSQRAEDILAMIRNRQK